MVLNNLTSPHFSGFDLLQSSKNMCLVNIKYENWCVRFLGRSLKREHYYVSMLFFPHQSIREGRLVQYVAVALNLSEEKSTPHSALPIRPILRVRNKPLEI